MIAVAKLIRQERKLSVDESQISMEMRRVMELEREIANVSHFPHFYAQILTQGV